MKTGTLFLYDFFAYARLALGALNVQYTYVIRGLLISKTNLLERHNALTPDCLSMDSLTKATDELTPFEKILKVKIPTLPTQFREIISSSVIIKPDIRLIKMVHFAEDTSGDFFTHPIASYDLLPEKDVIIHHCMEFSSPV